MKLYKQNAAWFKKAMDYYMDFLDDVVKEGTEKNFFNGIINRAGNVTFMESDYESIKVVASAACFFKKCKEKDFKDKVFNRANFGKIFKAMNKGCTGDSAGRSVDLIAIDILSQYDGDPLNFKDIENILPKQATGDDSYIDFKLAKETGIEIEQYENDDYVFDFGVDLEDLAKENADKKLKTIKDTIEGNYFASLDDVTNLLFSNNFLNECVKDIRAPRMLNENEVANLSGYVKTQLDEAKTLISNDQGKYAKQDACKKRLESYFLLKDKVQKRTWKDILFHPIKSYRESKMLKETKNMLSNDYKFSDNFLNKMEQMCITDRQVPNNTFCLKTDGEFIPNDVSQADIDKEYEQLVKDPQYKEYVYDNKELEFEEKLEQEFGNELDNSRGEIQNSLSSKNEELIKEDIEKEI